MIDVKRKIETNFPGYYKVPFAEFVTLTKEHGAVAVYLYSQNVLSSGEIYHFDDDDKKVRVINKKNVTVAPVSLFTRFLGAKAVELEDTITFTLGERSVSVGSDSDIALYSECGTYLVPIVPVADALGISYGVFHKDRLFVFAKKELLDELRNDYMLVRGACYAVFGEYKTEHLTHDDFVFVKNKWRMILVGSPEINDLSDPDIKAKVDAISDACEVAWRSLHKEPCAVSLFGETAPIASSDLLVQYGGIWKLVAGFGTYGSRFYRNDQLKNDILYAYQWMYENMYGESVIEGRGWRDPHLFNWWEWMTGAIEPMSDGLLVMEEFLDRDTLAKYFRCYDYVSTFHRVAYQEAFAATRLKVGTKVALLLEDRDRLFYRFLDYDLRFEPLGPEKGKYCDHVCWTHNFPYNMGYGLGHMHRTIFVTSAVIDTPVEYTSPDFYDLFLTAKYMYDAAMYRGRGFSEFRGRDFGEEKSAGAKALAGIISMIGAFGEDEDLYLKKMIKTSCTDTEVLAALKSALSICKLAQLNSILEDDSVSSVNDKELAHSWFTADRFAQHRNDYAFLLAMSSSRHMSYESINSAHKTGWYTGDGALYLYTNADDKSFEYPAFLGNINVCYRMPGVTADTRERKIWSHKSGWKPTKSFTGSMDFDKKYGMGAFDYEPYHYEGHEAEGTTDEGYGGVHVYHENDLTAKKSYHFFDKECVCLGAGITSTMNSPVRTTVEHRRTVAGGEAVTVCGEARVGCFDETVSRGFVTLEGVAGYVFPTETRANVRRYRFDPVEVFKDEYTAKLDVSSADFFELGIEHGANPTGAKYEYIILPLSDEKSTRVYANAPEVEIIENSERLQAVRKPSLGITSAALFEAGRIGPVSASEPCILMYRETDDSFELSVSDPTQKLESAVFTVDGEYTVDSLDVELSAEVKDGATVITANLERLAGKALRAILKK